MSKGLYCYVCNLVCNLFTPVVAALLLDACLACSICHLHSQIVCPLKLLSMRLDMLWGSGMSKADLTEMSTSM